MALTWPNKDPDEFLDYGLDWTARIGTDTIATSEWIVPADLTASAEDIQGFITVVWLSGGLEGKSYTITNRVTTQAGRIMDASAKLSVKSK